MGEQHMEDEDENFEEETGAPWDDLMNEDVPSMDPNDPLLRPVQEAMHKVLTGNVAKDVETVEGECKEIDKEWVKVHSEKTRVEDKIEACLSEQTTFERYASGEQKDAKKVHEEVSEKEVQVSQLQNELSRIRVDSLNTLAHNNALKDTRNTILKDLEEKESLIDQIEVEIARKHTLIERKQVDIDKLNKRYEALTSGTEEENMGPLEATIYNANKEIAKKMD